MWRKLAHFISIGDSYLKNTRVLFGGISPGKIFLHGARDQRVPAFFVIVFLARPNDGSKEPVRIEISEREAVAFCSIEVSHGVRQAAGAPDYRNSAVAHRLHLHEPGRFKTRGYQHHVRAGKNQCRQNVVKKIMSAETPWIFFLKFLKKKPILVIPAADHYHLKINVVKKRLRNLYQQVKSFLFVHPRNNADNKFLWINLEIEFFLQNRLVFSAHARRVPGVDITDTSVGLRVKNFIINGIQNSEETGALLQQKFIQAFA